MKSKQLVNYVVGSLAAVALIALAAWLVRSEGERTRRAIRQAALEAEAESEGETARPAKNPIEPAGKSAQGTAAGSSEAPKAIPQEAKDGSGRPVNPPGSAQNAPESTAGDPRSDGHKTGKAEALADSKAAAPATKPVEDFDLDDHDVFPGLSRSNPKARKAIGSPDRVPEVRPAVCADCPGRRNGSARGRIG